MFLEDSERRKWWKVYVLHFLFMWNTRTYEYASIILVSQAFPHSLTAASIRGITSTVSAMLCSSLVGSWIDDAPSGLKTLLITIFTNHGAITAVYLCWPFLAIHADDASDGSQPQVISLARGSAFILILLLDVIHDLSAIGNRLSLERNWVPVLVSESSPDTSHGLTQVNAVMRRIDLICKLVAPSFLPLIMSSQGDRHAWIWLVAAITILFLVLEVWGARAIARENPLLSRAKTNIHDNRNHEILSPKEHHFPHKTHTGSFYALFWRLTQYFSEPIWPASMSMAIHNMTVLAYSSALITYLLQAGFSLSSITIARASGSVMALASTFMTPVVVRYLKRRRRGHGWIKEKAYDGYIVRKVGLWGCGSQFLCLLPVVTILWSLSSATSTDPSTFSQPPPTASSYALPSLLLFTFLSLSRIGLWTFDLMVQELEQVEIPPLQRSTFAGTEQSFGKMFELMHWGWSVMWNKPEEFRWLAVASGTALGVGVVMYGTWCSWGRESVGERGYEEVGMLDFEREED